MQKFFFLFLSLIFLGVGALSPALGEIEGVDRKGGVPATQLIPQAPVRNFLFPRFAENGFTQWILRGERAIYDSVEQLRVEGMELRLFSADERMLREMSLTSPRAVIRLQENRAYSDSSLDVQSERFQLGGSRWEWDGGVRRVQVDEDASVVFAEGLNAALSLSMDADPEAGRSGGGETRVSSERLVLEMSDDEHRFSFYDGVDLVSRDLHLRSSYLVALAEPPAGAEGSVLAAADGTFRHALARGNVIIAQNERLARAEEAEFAVADERLLLRGNPGVALPGAYLSGETIELREGHAVIRGVPGQGRAQLILLNTGGLGLRGDAALASETIILADVIELTEAADENRFDFIGRVEILSGGLEIVADELEVVTGRVPLRELDADESSTIEIRRLVASGHVRIRQESQRATAGKVTFFPDEEYALLSGRPKIESDGATVIGETIELMEGRNIARAGSDVPEVVVTLPTLPDMGYQSSGDDGAEQPRPTVIRSRVAEMRETADSTRFLFSENVEVVGNNLNLTSESLLIESSALEEGASATDRLKIEEITAVGEVRIHQGTRLAEAGTARFIPADGRIILEDEPKVTDKSGGVVTGTRMILLQGERRAIIEGGTAPGERARITLPEIRR